MTHVIIQTDSPGQIIETYGPFTEEEAFYHLNELSQICGTFKHNANGCHSWEMGLNDVILTMYELDKQFNELYEEAKQW